jgi:hypothetical protein
MYMRCYSNVLTRGLLDNAFQFLRAKLRAKYVIVQRPNTARCHNFDAAGTAADVETHSASALFLAVHHHQCPGSKVTRRNV